MAKRWNDSEKQLLRSLLDEAAEYGAFRASDVVRLFRERFPEGRWTVAQLMSFVRRTWPDKIGGIIQSENQGRLIPPEVEEKLGGATPRPSSPAGNLGIGPARQNINRPRGPVVGAACGKSRPMRRVLAIADTHCGSRVGLTPPEFQYDTDTKYGRLQKIYWDYFTAEVDRLRPIDVLLFVGDAIEGKADIAGGSDVSTADRMVQVNMALRIVQFIGAPVFVIAYGTPYHTGKGEDWESILFHRCKDTMDFAEAKIGANEDVIVNGLVFNIKHKVGASQIPHGRHTSIARERLWNLLWAERGQREKADVLIRAHVHYFGYCGGPDFLAMTLPALQGLGSKFGERQCSGLVDFGFVHFDVESADRYRWEPHILELSETRATPVEV